MAEVNALLRLQVREEVSQAMKSARDEMKRMQDNSDELKGHLSNIFTIATGISLSNVFEQAAEGVKRFAIESLNAAAEMQILNTKAEVLFGSDLPQMNDRMDEMATKFHRSDDEVRRFVTSADMFTRSMGLGKTEAENMSMGMSRLAIEIGKATGANDGEAFDMLQRALRGYGKALIDVGIDLNAHVLQEYLDNQGIHEKYTALTDASKAMVAYHYLLEKEPTIMAMADKNTGGYTEKIKELDAAWNNLEDRVGKFTIGPATNEIQSFINDLDTLNTLWDYGPFGSKVFDKKGNIATTGIPKELSDYKTWMGSSPTNELTPEEIAARDEGNKWGAGLGTMGDDSGAKKMEDLRSSLEALKQKYDDTTTSIKEKLTDLEQSHKDKLQSIDDQIATTGNHMADLAKKYKQAMEDINNTKADKVGGELEKIRGMQENVNKYMLSPTGLGTDQVTSILANRQDKEGDTLSARDVHAFGLTSEGESQINATMALQKEQGGYADWLLKNARVTPDQKNQLYAGNANFSATAEEIVKANPNLEMGWKRSQQTDFTKSMGEEDKKGKEKMSTFDDDKKKDLDTLKSLENKRKVEEEAYVAQRSQLKQTQSALAAFHGDYINAMDDMAKVTKQQVTEMTKQLQALSQTMSTSKANLIGEARADQKTAARAGGGYVNEDLTLVGERGPELVSLPTGSYVHTAQETQSMTGGVTITFGDMYISKEVDADDVIRRITRAIQTQKFQSSPA